jgi:hypothetical protein
MYKYCILREEAANTFDPYQVKPDFRMSIGCFFTKYAVFVHVERGRFRV